MLRGFDSFHVYHVRCPGVSGAHHYSYSVTGSGFDPSNGHCYDAIMTKFRAFIVALILAITSAGFAVSQSVTPVGAALANCAKGGQYFKTVNAPPLKPITNFSTYAGIICFANGAGGGSVRLTITCKYEYPVGFSHTYTVYGGWAAVGAWSWASCTDHRDAYNYPDYIIHACPQMSVGASSWGSDFCF